MSNDKGHVNGSHGTSHPPSSPTGNSKKLRPPTIAHRPSGRLIFLDGLRGLFALFVLYQHFVSDARGLCHPSFTARLGSHIGVPGFFTLSAYLLTFNLHRAMQRIVTSVLDLRAETTRMKLAVCFVNYTIKRVWRILPPVVVVAVIGKQILPTILPGAQIFPAASFYDLITLRTAGLSVLWTIPVEMRYYLVIPIYVLAIHLSSLFLPVFIMGSFTIEAYEAPLDHPELNIRVFFRTFLMGSVLGTLHFWVRRAVEQPESVNRYLREVVGYHTSTMERIGVRGRWMVTCVVDLLIFALLGYGITFLPPYAEKPWVWTGNWAGFFVAMIMILCMNSPDGLVTKSLESPVLMYYGKISFSAYLLHMVVHIYYERFVSMVPSVDHAIWQLVITTVASHVMFYSLEKPVMDFAEVVCKRVVGFGERMKVKQVDQPLLSP
ncbi:hypothetical protein HDU67_002738 [Dinochytrium kinnereticum]|nr:hypothetical protein HDU67_002738 [Dinochytrium kinnereticum]